jgi:hypothetical protein
MLLPYDDIGQPKGALSPGGNIWNSPPKQTREKRLALKCKNAYPLILNRIHENNV